MPETTAALLIVSVLTVAVTYSYSGDCIVNPTLYHPLVSDKSLVFTTSSTSSSFADYGEPRFTPLCNIQIHRYCRKLHYKRLRRRLYKYRYGTVMV